MSLRSATLLGAPIGANLNQVSEADVPLYNLGARVLGTDGGEYVYVQAGAAITSAVNGPNAVAIDEDFQAVLMTTALALAGHELGFAPIANTVADVPLIPDNAYFFAQVKGSNCSGRVSASASADAYLRTTIVPGRLGTASTASAVVFTGCVLVVAASASGGSFNQGTVREVLMTQGRAVRQGASTFVN
jgi:hypothetical protein